MLEHCAHNDVNLEAGTYTKKYTWRENIGFFGFYMGSSVIQINGFLVVEKYIT